MITDLTGMDIANASLLDEGTAAAEAMTLCHRQRRRNRRRHLFCLRALPSANDCRGADPRCTVGIESSWAITRHMISPLPLARCAISGDQRRYLRLCAFVVAGARPGALVVVAADLLALTLLRPPGEFGADVVVGNSQRFGVPMGLAVRMRLSSPRAKNSNGTCPAALVGVSEDAQATRPCGWPCKRASNTSAAKKRPVTFVRPRFCWPSWPRCMRSIMGQEGFGCIAQRVQLVNQPLAQSPAATRLHSQRRRPSLTRFGLRRSHRSQKSSVRRH